MASGYPRASALKLVCPALANEPVQTYEENEREWSGSSKRAGVDPGSKIRLEPFREPGSAPAKPLSSLTQDNDGDHQRS